MSDQELRALSNMLMRSRLATKTIQILLRTLSQLEAQTILTCLAVALTKAGPLLWEYFSVGPVVWRLLLQAKTFVEEAETAWRRIRKETSNLTADINGMVSRLGLPDLKTDTAFYIMLSSRRKDCERCEEQYRAIEDAEEDFLTRRNKFVKLRKAVKLVYSDCCKCYRTVFRSSSRIGTWCMERRRAQQIEEENAGGL